MVKNHKDKFISFTDISQSLEQGISGADQLRAMNLKGLHRMHRVKVSGLRREKERLSKKLGPNHPRVVTLTHKIEVNQGLMRDLTIELERAKIEIPDVDENTWILHGFVRNKNLKGLPNLTVALYEKRGKWIEQLGYACTDKIGYFKIIYSLRRDNGVNRAPIPIHKAKQGLQVFIHILDKQGEQLYVDQRPVVPQLGQVDYREIILGDEVDTCRPPDDSYQPKFEEPKGEDQEKDEDTKPEEAEMLKLEDIMGIGSRRAGKLRDAGIKTVRAFVEADEAKLRKILGNISIREMQNEGAVLLKKLEEAAHEREEE
ncbi:MAG: hypothetical protein GY801_29180 [bacterium]|nr:hypothetical protein [bacterium]